MYESVSEIYVFTHLFASVPQPCVTHAEPELSPFGLATLLTTQTRAYTSEIASVSQPCCDSVNRVVICIKPN